MMCQPYIGIFVDGAEQWCKKVGLVPPSFTAEEKVYYTALRQGHKLFEKKYLDYSKMLNENSKRVINIIMIKNNNRKFLVIIMLERTCAMANFVEIQLYVHYIHPLKRLEMSRLEI